MHPACPNKKQNHLQNSLLRRTQFWIRKTFSKPASLKRASLVVHGCPQRHRPCPLGEPSAYHLRAYIEGARGIWQDPTSAYLHIIPVSSIPRGSLNLFDGADLLHFFNIATSNFTCKCASRHNGVCFFISHLARLRTRRSARSSFFRLFLFSDPAIVSDNSVVRFFSVVVVVRICRNAVCHSQEGPTSRCQGRL